MENKQQDAEGKAANQEDKIAVANGNQISDSPATAPKKTEPVPIIFKVPPKLKTNPILRPNPNWEEDLAWATAMEVSDYDRLERYPYDTWLFKQSSSKACACTKLPFTGVALLVPLRSGKLMPRFGLGTWLGPGVTGSPNDTSVERAVEVAIDAGYRHIDTAAIYGTEEQVGRAVNNKIAEGVVRREDMFITTKLWNDAHEPKDVIPALRKSLKRLNLTYVDLYLIHWPVGQANDGSFYETDHLDTWRAMQEARDQGLTRSIGVSNFNIEQLQRLISLNPEPPAVLQVEINLNLQQPELLAYCCFHNISVVGYTPFGSLFSNNRPPALSVLESAITDIARKHHKTTCQTALCDIGRKHHKTMCQIVLRYLLELGVTPIPKSVHQNRIEENIQVFDFQLTQEDRDILKRYDVGYRTIAPEHMKGSRYYPFEKNQK